VNGDDPEDHAQRNADYQPCDWAPLRHVGIIGSRATWLDSRTCCGV
jgi:hypothetical protein